MDKPLNGGNFFVKESVDKHESVIFEGPNGYVVELMTYRQIINSSTLKIKHWSGRDVTAKVLMELGLQIQMNIDHQAPVTMVEFSTILAYVMNLPAFTTEELALRDKWKELTGRLISDKDLRHLL